MTRKKIRVFMTERDRELGCCYLLIFVHFLFWMSFTKLLCMGIPMSLLESAKYVNLIKLCVLIETLHFL